MERRAGKRALAFVLVTVLLDMIGIGLIVPVVPAVLRELTGKAPAEAAAYGGYLFFAYAAMQFVCAPIIGNLSDAFGRRPVLLLSVFGLGVDYLLTALAPSLTWLFVGRVVAGFFGASYSTASAYIADVTEPEERGRAFGYIGAAWGVGFVLGPAIGGLLGGLGSRVPFFVAAGLSLANVAYGGIVLPETLLPSKRRPFTLAHANPLGALAAVKNVASVRRIATALFVFFLAHSVYPAVWSFYTMSRYDWDERAVGLSLALYGILGSVVQGALVGPAIKRLGEKRAATISISLDVLALAAVGFATNGWMVLLVVVLQSPSGIAMPAISAVMSNATSESEQGALQGCHRQPSRRLQYRRPALDDSALPHVRRARSVREDPGRSVLRSGGAQRDGARHARADVARLVERRDRVTVTRSRRVRCLGPRAGGRHRR